MASKKLPIGERVEPASLEAKTREISEVGILDLIPLNGVMQKFNKASCIIQKVTEPAVGYEISQQGQTCFVPMTAVLYVKYSREST